MLIININFGPVAVWCSALILVVWLGLFLWRVAVGTGEYRVHKEISRRREQTLIAPHIATGRPLAVLRVNKDVAIIGHRWDHEAEEDEQPWTPIPASKPSKDICHEEPARVVWTSPSASPRPAFRLASGLLMVWSWCLLRLS